MTELELLDLEHRPERAYDERDPSRIFHPTGSRMLTAHRDLSAAILREVLVLSPLNL